MLERNIPKSDLLEFPQGVTYDEAAQHTITRLGFLVTCESADSLEWGVQAFAVCPSDDCPRVMRGIGSLGTATETALEGFKWHYETHVGLDKAGEQLITRQQQNEDLQS